MRACQGDGRDPPLPFLSLSFYHGQVAVISRNRVEWVVGCMASLSLGASWVPMYPQQRINEIEYILKDSAAKLLLVADERLYDKTRHFVGSIPSLREIWTFDVDVPARLANVTSGMVSAAMATDPSNPDDVAVLIYTSGTTGKARIACDLS